MMKTKLVIQGYDKIAAEYLAGRAKLKSSKYVQKLVRILPKGAIVLDLGCGAGVPVDDVLLKAGFEVIGIDNSRVQIDLARKKCPKGQYLVKDIRDLRKGEYQVQAVVAFYAIFHIPRAEQAKLFEIIASYLIPGGKLLVTMGDAPFEGEHNLYGSSMWSSQYGTRENLKMIEKAGFRVILAEIDKSGGESHQVILGVKT